MCDAAQAARDTVAAIIGPRFRRADPITFEDVRTDRLYLDGAAIVVRYQRETLAADLLEHATRELLLLDRGADPRPLYGRLLAEVRA